MSSLVLSLSFASPFSLQPSSPPSSHYPGFKMSAITLSKNICTLHRTIKSQGLSVLSKCPSSLGFSRTISKPLVLSSSKCFRTTSMAVYKVKLIGPDGKEHELEAPDDAYILDSAEVAGLGLPYSCRAGTCSYCTARIASGSVDQSEGYFLDDSQKEKGYILTCISYPTSDCVIHTHKESELYT